MTHYDLSQWSDFARGLLAYTERDAMQEHLWTCPRCTRAVSLLQKLVAATAADAHYNVPPYAVQNAKAIFGLHGPEKVTVAQLVAKLVFDSFHQQPLPGFRAEQQRLTRQALYEAGDYCLDVRMERERDAEMIVLVGQVLDRKNPSATLANIPVVLFSGKKVIARAVSNAFGEFQMQYRHQGNMRLHLPIKDGGNEIYVSLQSNGTRG